MSRSLPVLPSPETPDIKRLFALANLTVARLALPVLPEADYDDWQAIAFQAALKAVRTYRPERQVALKSWIIQQIRWGLKEALRNFDPAGRAARDRWKDYEAQQRAYEAGARPAPPEPEPPLRQRPVSLEGLAVQNEESETPVFEREEHWALADDWSEEQVVTRLALRAALRHLAPREREVVQLRMGGHTNREIGGHFGVCESRAHQYYQEAILALRRALGVPSEEPALPPQRGRAGRTVRETPRHRQIVALCEAGLTASEIAARLAVKLGTIHTFVWEARVLGLLPPPAGTSALDAAQVIELHRAGRSQPQIAAALKTTPSRVRRAIATARAAGQLPPPDPLLAARARHTTVCRLAAEGLPLYRIAERVGLSAGTVRNILGLSKQEGRAPGSRLPAPGSRPEPFELGAGSREPGALP